MSENLIYGADITAYGAVGDGKYDCSDAFLKAIENGESLISVPFGIYKITKDITLKSNTKLHLHNNSKLMLDGAKIAAKDAHNIIICGGEINGGINFEDVDGIKLQNVSLFQKVSLSNCENIKISNTNLYESAFFSISGNCQSLTVKNTTLIKCSYLLNFEKAYANQVKCDTISGAFCESFIRVSSDSKLEDADFESISIHHLTNDIANQAHAYFNLSGMLSGIEIENFKRENEYESLPFIPSIILSPNKNTSMILDGTGLDNVISARGASKTVAMTTARLTNPCGKFIYTLECGINVGDTFTMPLGDFDLVSIYEK